MARAALDLDRLERELLPTGSVWTRIEVVTQTPSTNADAARAARSGAPEGLVVTAEHQTAGRGRLGREWQAPPRSGLAVSVLLRPTGIPSLAWPWLPLLTGVAVASAVADTAGLVAGLKWPNDVLVEERKLAGILVERVETATTPAAVIGIGINVDLTDDELPVPDATSLLLAGAGEVDRTALLVEVLARLAGWYETWRHSGGDASHGLRAAYQEACTTLGQRVRATLPGGSAVVGVAADIDASGRLLVDTDAGRRALAAADVVHLRSGS